MFRSRRRCLSTIVAVAAVAASAVTATTSATGAASITQLRWPTARAGGVSDPFAAETRLMTSNSLRWIHTTWWRQVFAPQEARHITYLDTTLNECQTASAAYATAIMLRAGLWNTTKMGVTATEAKRRMSRWLSGLAVHHKATWGSKGWGLSWQSAQWAYYTGYAAWLEWDAVPSFTKDRILKLVTAEANRLLTITPPYYRRADGSIVTPGDSKAEENGWNAPVLLLAAQLMPSHVNAKRWEQRGKDYMLTAYASPRDVGRYGARVTGSNLEANGTVINHGIVHPDYMAAITEGMIKTQLMYGMRGKAVPWETWHNFDAVWSALTTLRFTSPPYRSPGGTIWTRTSSGSPSWTVYFPQGDDWGGRRAFNYAQVDLEAAYQRLPHDAATYTHLHLQKTLKQQARHADGHIFEPGEEGFNAVEQFAAAEGAEDVMLGILRAKGYGGVGAVPDASR